MKLVELHEMTMRVSSYEKLADSVHHFQQLKAAGTHVGDIEHYSVYSEPRGEYQDYALFDGDNIASFFVTKPKQQIFDIAFTVQEYRRKGLLQAFMLFLRRHEGYDKIIMGDLQSEDTIKALKRIYLQFDDVYWERDKERQPYHPETVDRFYGHKKTGWRLIFEGELLAGYPRFVVRNTDGTIPDNVNLLEEIYFGHLSEE